MTSRSSASSRSRRAVSSASIVGGTLSDATSPTCTHWSPSRRRVPSSMSIESSCSTKSGFPAAACRIWPVIPALRPVPPSKLSTTRPASASLSGRSTSRMAWSSSPHSGIRSMSSWRLVQRSRTDASATVSTRDFRSSRKVDSAQWMSSMIATTGRLAASSSRKRRAAQKSSGTGNAVSDAPTTEARRSTTSGSDISDCSFAWTTSAGSSAWMPDASRTISRNGQNVMPSP